MAWEKKVVWSEGMMLQPQHFQQQARYHEAQLRNTIGLISPFLWGISNLTIDQTQLKHGKFCLQKAEGIMADGSYFNFPEVDNAPKAIDINETHLDKTLYLALTIRRFGNTEVSRDEDEFGQYRNAVSEIELRDIATDSSLQQAIEVGGFSFAILSDNDDLSEYCCVPIAVIKDVSNEGVVKLKEDFVPPYLNIKQSAYVSGFLTELLNLTQHRISALAQRVNVSGKASTSDISDFLLLQTLNRHYPILQHLTHVEHVTATALYEKLIAIIGDMSTFINADKQVVALPVYQHKLSADIFPVLINELRKLFSVVLEQNSINIPLDEKKYGIRIGAVADATLYSSASFVLAVSADIPADDLRQYFPAQVKIGSVEQIKELVNVQLPGVQLNSLAVAPREIPYKRDYVYFELIQQGEYWLALTQSGGIALHVGLNFPNLSMELWAIRDK